MNTRNIITGKKYNMISPLEIVGKYKDGSLMWKCQCECGNVKNIRSTSIGKIKSCGCIKTISRLITPGQKYGMLTAIEEMPRENRWGHFFKFRCDCGKEKISSATHVFHGKTNSCGCLHKKSVVSAANINRKNFGESTLKMLYINAKDNATRRNKQFVLTFDEYCELVQRECYYCQEPPHKYKTKRYYGHVFINGLDRIDSSLGYFKDNIVPCCKTCNSAKGELTQDQFYAWIDRVSKNKPCINK